MPRSIIRSPTLRHEALGRDSVHGQLVIAGDDREVSSQRRVDDRIAGVDEQRPPLEGPELRLGRHDEEVLATDVLEDPRSDLGVPPPEDEALTTDPGSYTHLT